MKFEPHETIRIFKNHVWQTVRKKGYLNNINNKRTHNNILFF
jgi:hypothetical protein